MPMKMIMAAVACATVLLAGGGDFVVEGECPAISRDGTKLAFQRVEGTHMHLGVLDLASGDVTWVVRGETAATAKENACQPAWCPDGSLVYAYANITNTAYQRFSSKGPKVGYSIRRWKDGRSTELVGGFARNFSPFVTADGRKLLFCRQDGKGEKDTRICELDLDRPGTFRTVHGKPAGDAGVCQPVVSPDGRLIAWAELPDFGVTWRIRVARVGRTDASCELTPAFLPGYAPCFLPDSRHLVFTGFNPGEPGWGVYVIDVGTGAYKRIADGEDPCVSPDGRTLYYANGGRIRRLPIDARTFEGLAPQDRPNLAAEAEKVVLRRAALKPGEKVAVPDDGAGPQATRFMRFTFDMDENNGRRAIANISWQDKAQLHFFTLERAMSFVSRERTDNGRKLDDGTVLSKGTHRVTGVRGGDGRIYLSIDDGPVQSLGCGYGLMPIAGEGTMQAFGDAALNVRDIEYGLGWPKNVPAPLTGKDLLD